VRKANNDTLIVADGFSCREQIRQTTHRGGLHLAEVLHLAMQKAVERGQGRATGNGALAAYPERSYIGRAQDASHRDDGRGRIGLVIGATAFLIGGVFIGSRLASASEVRRDR
jgi:hypothetical protein